MKFPKKKYSNIKSFFEDYLIQLDGLKLVNFLSLEKACKIIEKTIITKKKIFVCGNGGSAAIANHYLCDYLKLLRTKTSLKPIVHSLSTSIEMITAISNDISYNDVFKYQAECLATKGDIFLIVSSSGNSENVVRLAKYAKRKGLKVISFTGFTGGKLRKNSDINIHVNVSNYGLAEDSHHILMHIIMQYLRQKYLTSSLLKTKF